MSSEKDWFNGKRKGHRAPLVVGLSCLREIKKQWDAWQQISTDTKYLDDMPEYWIQARKHNLPKRQYTARDVSTGALFLGFADDLSITYATLFKKRIMQRLKKHAVDFTRVTFVVSWR